MKYVIITIINLPGHVHVQYSCKHYLTPLSNSPSYLFSTIRYHFSGPLVLQTVNDIGRFKVLFINSDTSYSSWFFVFCLKKTIFVTKIHVFGL